MNSDSGILSTAPLQDIHEHYSNFKEIACTKHSVLTIATSMGRKWVIKSLTESLRDDAMHIALLEKEYNILCELNHPYIVRVHELTELPSFGRCIVMEYIEGETLCTTDYDKETKLRLASQLIEAVEYVHSLQIVHRDLKPSNIIVTNNGKNLKLIDFDLSDTDAHTILKQPAGTERYISPEQRIANVPDVRNDIYSLGIILQDMNLGWQFRPMVRRMLATVDKRYATMADVDKAFRNASRFPQRLFVAVLLAIVIALASIVVFTNNSNSDKVDESVGNVRKEMKDKMSKQQEKIDSQQSVITQQQQEISRQEERIILHQSAIDHQDIVLQDQSQSIAVFNEDKEAEKQYELMVSAGKKLIDDYMGRNSYTKILNRYDVMDSNSVRKYNELHSGANTLITDFVNDQKLAYIKSTELRNQIYEYLISKYYEPIYLKNKHQSDSIAKAKRAVQENKLSEEQFATLLSAGKKQIDEYMERKSYKKILNSLDSKDPTGIVVITNLDIGAMHFISSFVRNTKLESTQDSELHNQMTNYCRQKYIKPLESKLAGK